MTKDDRTASDPLLAASPIPDLEWLAACRGVDDSWRGPGPNLVNLRPWMESLAGSGHGNLVAATYAAATLACRQWDDWLVRSPEIACQSLVDSQSPAEQLAAVARWLESPISAHKGRALSTVDLTKQLHWFDEEYRDVWFDEPGMWAIEAIEYCVLTLAGDPHSDDSPATLATTSVACALNSLRTSANDDIRDPLRLVMKAIRSQLEARIGVE